MIFLLQDDKKPRWLGKTGCICIAFDWNTDFWWDCFPFQTSFYVFKFWPFYRSISSLKYKQTQETTDSSWRTETCVGLPVQLVTMPTTGLVMADWHYNHFLRKTCSHPVTFASLPPNGWKYVQWIRNCCWRRLPPSRIEDISWSSTWLYASNLRCIPPQSTSSESIISLLFFVDNFFNDFLIWV